MSKTQSGPARAGRPRPTPTVAKSSGGQTNARRRTNNPRPAQGGARSGPRRPTGNRSMLKALVPVALVILVLVTLVVIKTTGGSSGGTGPAQTSKVVAGSDAAGSDNGTTALPAGVLSDATSVSSQTFATIGVPSAVSSAVTTKKGTAVLSSDGKPEILYVGAEFCPFCAAQRWPLVVALSRFGTFSGLRATHSSTSDVYPDTQTFSFYGSTYTSSAIDFVPVEEQTNQIVGNTYGTLQTPTAAENAVLAKFDVAPYTSEPGSIPFLDVGNKYITVGASYTPQVLQGLSMQQIAAQLNNKNSAVAIAIDGEANQITAEITALTGVQPNSTGPTNTNDGA